MATVYSTAINSSGSYVRSRCDYTISHTGSATTVSGTVYFQHKGAADSYGSFAKYAFVGFTSAPHGIVSSATDTAKVSKVSKHTSWTNVASKAFSATFQHEQGAKTMYLQTDTSNLIDVVSDTTKTVGFTLPSLPSYAVTYDANGGVGAPAAQVKYEDTSLRLSTQKPTRENCHFVKWSGSDGNDYQPGYYYTANAELTLTAVWISVPQITSLIAVRCSKSGSTYTDDDEGTYARISCAWSIDPTIDAQASATVTGTITPQGGTASAITIESGGSGTSGTAIAHPSNLDPDTQYSVTITVTNGTQATSRTVIITRAFFIMDFRAGGGGIGIGRAAPASGLEVGYDATFDADVLMREDLTVTGDASAATVTDGNGNAISNHSHPSGTGGYAGLFTVAGRTAYPLFVYATAPDEADLPVTPCFVLATGDYGLWYYDGN